VIVIPSRYELVTNPHTYETQVVLLRNSLRSAANIPLVPSAFAQESVSITLGTNNVENGLFLKEPDGGATTVVIAGGSEARSTAPPAGKTGQFMYFATDPAFANNGSVSNLWVTVEYFDQGTNSFRLEYDAQPDPNNVNPDTDALLVASAAGSLRDLKQWLSYTFVLRACFSANGNPVVRLESTVDHR
jgi:hypothetical protein